jgi:ATP-dependent RNA helicase SUPV3L1/SUV3
MATHDPGAKPALRSVLAMLVDEGGIIARDAVAKPLGQLDKEERRRMARLKIRIGALDLFMPEVLRPEARRWRAALRSAAAGLPMPALPAESSVVLPTPDDQARDLLTRLGFRALGPQMLRVDIAERLARHAHEARAGKQSQVVDEALVTSLGLQPQALAKLLRDVGFRPSSGEAGWVWRGKARERQQAPTDPSHAFAALAGLRRG